MAMRSSATVATLYSAMAIAGALLVAAFGPKIYWIAMAAAYIVGSEVLWRMTEAAGPWEIGKLATAAISLIGLVRLRRYIIPVAPAIYLLLMTPGAFITCIRTMGVSPFPRLATHFSGPVAVTMATCFFLNCRVTKIEFNRILLAAAIPISSVSFLAARGTFSSTVHFGNQSLSETSGGFGPNQVSAMLSFGTVAFSLYLFSTPTGLWRKLLALAIILACLGQSALTLSRGGFYTYVGAMLPAMIFFAVDGKSRLRVLVSVAAADRRRPASARRIPCIRGRKRAISKPVTAT
jgi:hypothetical protein